MRPGDVAWRHLVALSIAAGLTSAAGPASAAAAMSSQPCRGVLLWTRCIRPGSHLNCQDQRTWRSCGADGLGKRAATLRRPQRCRIVWAQAHRFTVLVTGKPESLICLRRRSRLECTSAWLETKMRVNRMRRQAEASLRRGQSSRRDGSVCGNSAWLVRAGYAHGSARGTSSSRYTTTSAWSLRRYSNGRPDSFSARQPPSSEIALV
jgi:hypothetical protein